MATFISTIKFTEKGIADIKDTCQRSESFRKSAKKMGAKVLDIFWTQGHYDGLIVFEAPDDLTATALMVRLCSAGFVLTQTTRAYRSDEMSTILEKV